MEKHKIPSSREELQSLIDSKIGENGSLEYKAGGALNRKNQNLRDDITKDVSAFANAAGGILIYGIGEFTSEDKKHWPEKITAIDATDYTREWLDQMIGQIQPRIEGLEIVPVHVGPKDTDFCYVVSVPQSSTAHQATDKRYYRRRNFENTMMDDAEIRDVMNRRKHPLLSVKILIQHQRNAPTNIRFKITNVSLVMARYYSILVALPTDFGYGYVAPDERDRIIVHGDGGIYWQFSKGNGIASPLFPHEVKFFSTDLIPQPPQYAPIGRSIPEIRITAFADSMEPQSLVKDYRQAMNDWI